MLKSWFDVKTEVVPSRVTGSDCDCYATDESQDLTENCPETDTPHHNNCNICPTYQQCRTFVILVFI